ncbi:MAG: bleomycin resistance protein [Pseudonocardiales bacterium]|nr:VOC family protein [Actinomycetota bacterium]PZS12272.1 MAG: bleomycin resistance protein [Pseudonocardiales bacterium]
MTIELNHTIVAARDKRASAMFLTDLLGLPAPTSFGPFLVVSLANGVSLDFVDTGEDIRPQHYAFLVSDAEFETIFDRIRAQDLQYWADPFKQQPGETNTRDGGHGVYFDDPDGHVLELLTRPYGTGSLT